MPRYTAEQIYAFARAAGFSPDQSATMTAIALADSGGQSRAHNPHGQDSQGLWQINADAHPELAQRFDLYDPAQNAQAAFAVSHGGTDVSPWPATHNGSSARYLRFRDEAQSAAAAHGDGDNRGVWSGTSGYGDKLSAGPDGGGTSISDDLSSTGQDRTVPAQTAEHGSPLDEPGRPTGGQGGSKETADTPATGDALRRLLDSVPARTGDRDEHPKISVPERFSDDFDSRLELDPDALDSNPEVLTDSHDLTNTPIAPPHPGIPENQHLRLPETAEAPHGVVQVDPDIVKFDPDADGFENSLRQTTDWAEDIPDTPDLLPPDIVVDHTPGP